ncbi:MAG: cytosine deaminase [Microcoleaceae cyanobacterium]
MIPNYDLILRNGLLLLSPTQIEPGDIAINSGKIAAIAPHILGTSTQEIDVQGKLISPPFVESHIHLDSALTAGEPRWNQSGTLFEGIKIWEKRKQDLTLADVKNRAITTLKRQAEQGILWVRTHVDVSQSNLVALQALLAVREAVKDWITVQVIAFPQDGIYSRPENEVLLEKSLEMGADGVGGIPHYEFTREDGVNSIHKVFELATKYGCLIDIHCDEIDDDQSRFLEVVAACAIRTSMGANVTASHTTALSSYNNAYAFKLMGLLERSQINFVANPLINITLQGRTDTYPKRRGITRVKELWQQGLNVSLGHDCIQDPWYSLGTGNMLDVAHMAVHVCQMTGVTEIEACYNMVTWNGAKTLNLAREYGLNVDQSANLIVLDAESPYAAIRDRSTVQWVICQGKVLVETELKKARFYQ